MLGTLHGNCVGVLANIATEMQLRHQSRDQTTHLDTRETWSLYREAQMLLGCIRSAGPLAAGTCHGRESPLIKKLDQFLYMV